MAQDISIATIQSPLHWHDAQANRNMFAKRLQEIKEDVDIIVLPEMFTTGFSMSASTLAEKMDGPSINWLQEMAAKMSAVITGSLIIEEGSHYYNRLIWMRPDGTYDHYDKRHLFAMAGEHEHFTAGTERLIVSYEGWRICPLVCYDLRFPAWARNQDEYDVLIYMANWPDKRARDWKTLIRARAIENQAYTIAVNRIGTDGNGHNYNGDSCVIDAGWDYDLYDAGDREEIQVTRLSYEHLMEVRGRLPFLKDRDKVEVS